MRVARVESGVQLEPITWPLNMTRHAEHGSSRTHARYSQVKQAARCRGQKNSQGRHMPDLCCRRNRQNTQEPILCKRCDWASGAATHMHESLGWR